MSMSCPLPVFFSVMSVMLPGRGDHVVGPDPAEELVGVAAADLSGAGDLDAPGVPGVPVGVRRQVGVLVGLADQRQRGGHPGQAVRARVLRRRSRAGCRRRSRARSSGPAAAPKGSGAV